EELAALFGACAADPTPAGRRDAGLLALVYFCGLRRSEPVKLELVDVDLATATLTIRRAKGGKDRRGYLTAAALGLLRAWLTVRGGEPGPLFRPISKTGRVLDRRLSAAAVRGR